MDKIIPFNKGIHRDPSQNPIGELDMCVNLVSNGAELTNIGDMQLKNIVLPDNGIYIGKIDYTGDSDLHFCNTENTLYYLKTEKEHDGLEVDFTGGSVKSKRIPELKWGRTVGKCLVLQSENATYYYIIKDGSLVEFSDAIKSVGITFGLTAEERVSEKDSFRYQGAANDFGGYYAAFKPHIGPKILSFISKVEQEGKFVNPFFVRYAYRLYDGSTKFVSNPVLMPCCNKYGAVAYTEEKPDYVEGSVNYHTANSYVGCFAHDLYYTCYNSDIGEFNSIIQSIDVYVAPVKFATKRTAEYFDPDDALKSYHGKVYSNGGLEEDFKWVEFSDVNNNIPPDLSGLNCLSCWSDEESKKSIENASVFYKLGEISLISGSWTKIPGKDINTLQQTLTEDFNGNYTTTSENCYDYNNRLFRGNLTRKLKLDYPFFKNVGCSYLNSQEKVDGDVYLTFSILGEDVHVYGSGHKISKDKYVPYLFFPHRSLKRMCIETDDGYCEIRFKEHPFLFGSYAYDSMKNLLGNIVTAGSGGYQVLDVLPNAIQLSEVNNPFTFLPQNEVYVGNGEILGMATASRAISEGQFGQYPIYIFCTDGVWSLGIATDGTISNVSPVSRDVCNNPNSITQIDNAVVFSTEQGLKMISGGEVITLSSSMHGINVSERKFFPEECFAYFGEAYKGFDSLVKDETRDFREILKTCRIAYDYANAQLRIYPEVTKEENNHKFYTYSLASGEFATSLYEGTLNAVIPSWPSTLVQMGGKVYQFSNTNDSTVFKDGILLTRPIALDEPFALKKLHDLRLKYTKHSVDTYCKVILFGSNDEENWEVLKSLRGRPWKYFRIGVITHMTDDDRLSGMVVRYELERTNKLR